MALRKAWGLLAAPAAAQGPRVAQPCLRHDCDLNSQGEKLHTELKLEFP